MHTGRLRRIQWILPLWALLLWSGCGKNEVQIKLNGLHGRQVRLVVESKIAVNFNSLVTGDQTFPEAEESDYEATVVTNTYLTSKKITVKGKPFKGIRVHTMEFDIPSEPPMERKGTIVFASNRDGARNWEIYSIKADGSELKNLSRFKEGTDKHPVWSPDGSKIVFVSDRNGLLNWEIYVMNADGSDQKRLTDHPQKDYAPCWSPDGSKIAFVSERDGKAQIYVMDADGSNLVKISDGTAPDEAPCWSPDGSKMAFVSDRYGTDRQGNNDLFIMHTDGSDIQRLTDYREYDLAPVWSHDGQCILFSSSRAGAEEIYIMKADGSMQTRLTVTDEIYEWEPAWSPDDLGMVYARGRGDNYDICIMDRAGRNLVNLTHDKHDNRHPSWRSF